LARILGFVEATEHAGIKAARLQPLEAIRRCVAECLGDRVRVETRSVEALPRGLSGKCQVVLSWLGPSLAAGASKP